MQVLAFVCGLLLVAVMLLAAACVGTRTWRGERSSRQGDEIVVVQCDPVDTILLLDALSPTEVEARLHELERKRAPKTKKDGVFLCYVIMPAPPEANYVCPDCGEKTLYPSPSSDLVEYELRACRERVAEMNRTGALRLELDELGFCRKCYPNAVFMALSLTVRYSDGTTCVSRDVEYEDLYLLQRFIEGERTYYLHGDERPLKEKSGRLRDLLGVD